MKLIFCPKCHDVLKLLRDQHRSCICGKSGGLYKEDGLHAIIYGSAIPVGFTNLTFAFALNNRPKTGTGKTFTAFVIPEKCDTIEVKKEEEEID